MEQVFEPLVEGLDTLASSAIEALGRCCLKVFRASLSTLSALSSVVRFAPMFLSLATGFDLSAQKPTAGPLSFRGPFNRFADVVGVITAVGQYVFGFCRKLRNLLQARSTLAYAGRFHAGQQRQHNPVFSRGYYHFKAVALDPTMVLGVTPGAVDVHAARNDALSALAFVPSWTARFDQALVNRHALGIRHVLAQRLASLQLNRDAKQAMRASIAVKVGAPHRESHTRQPTPQLPLVLLQEPILRGRG